MRRKISKVWNAPMQIGILLRLPYLELERFIQAGLEARGFTDFRPAHNQVMQHLPLAPRGARLTELAAAANVAKQSMAELVAHLEKHGYVRKARDPADARAQLIVRTPRADKLFAAVGELIDELEAQWAKCLGRKRFEELCDSLGDLCTLLGH